MIEKFQITKEYKVDPRTFGGLIYPSDFNTDYWGKRNQTGSPIARRIAQDQNFDKGCKR